LTNGRSDFVFDWNKLMFHHPEIEIIQLGYFRYQHASFSQLFMNNMLNSNSTSNQAIFSVTLQFYFMFYFSWASWIIKLCNNIEGITQKLQIARVNLDLDWSVIFNPLMDILYRQKFHGLRLISKNWLV
jgi:hypothetical protein